MNTWHCPVCGLDFAFHSELDWHVRETHSVKRSAGLAGQLERESVLSWSRLRKLQCRGGKPSVSLLLWTTPGPVMSPSDRAELRSLANEAEADLARRVRGDDLAYLTQRLAEAVLAAQTSPTDHGMAVFVSPKETAIVPLPFPPRETAVVNHMFATRDLLDGLQRFPMYRALMLRGPGFRLLEGQSDRLSEVLDWQVPNPSLAEGRRSAWTPGQRARAAFGAADRAIGERVAVLGRLPLVLLGRRRLIRQFLEHSPHAPSVVGQVHVWASMQTRTSAARMAAPLVHDWRQSHNFRYLHALTEADSAGEVVWGLDAVWEAVLGGQVARVWVQRDYREPARVADDGKRLVRAPNPTGPGGVPDAVNVLIEHAALAGAHVEMVDGLGLNHQERIAAQLGRPAGQEEAPGLEGPTTAIRTGPRHQGSGAAA